jgi:hypothetical protein
MQEPPWFFIHTPAEDLALAGILVTPFPPHGGELTAPEEACVGTIAAKLASLHRAGTLPDIATIWLNRADDARLPAECDPDWLRARVNRYLTVTLKVPRATEGTLH